ncbi:LCP family protein [Bacillus rugosus]|nr:LCP family protein [Bacillus rugosus]MEC1550119.1 LCP family protein [Bacillus rugosus]
METRLDKNKKDTYIIWYLLYKLKHQWKVFKDIVDAIGGITVNNEFPFTLEGAHIPKGEQHLDGKVALTYALMKRERTYLKNCASN